MDAYVTSDIGTVYVMWNPRKRNMNHNKLTQELYLIGMETLYRGGFDVYDEFTINDVALGDVFTPHLFTERFEN